MGDHLTFPLSRVPAVLPHADDLLVTLTKDESLQSFPITTPLTPDTILNSDDTHATLYAVQHLRQTFSSPFGTPDSTLDRLTWLRMILETLAGIHEGFRNAQLISPDADLLKSFQDLNTEELNTVTRIFEVSSWLQDFCEAAEEDHDDDHTSPFRTICICCIESTNLPLPPANITDIMLTNALEVQALRESLRNQAIRDVVKDIDAWRETQSEAMITDLVNCITSPDPDFDYLTHNVGNLDPCIANWVTSIHAPLRKAAVKLVTQEAIEDCIVPHAKELLESEWMRHQMEIEQEIRTRSDQHEAELRHLAEAYAQCLEQELCDQAEQTIADLKAKLETKLADNITQLKNHVKVSLQAARDEAESHSLTLAVHTPKAAKPSPLSITCPKKTKKKKSAVLDLTTPPPTTPPPLDNEAPSEHTDMETDEDSTPMTPICCSSAPSPAPLLPSEPLHTSPPPPPVAPETVDTNIANPDSIPRWAQTPSPDEKTPHAPTFPTTQPTPPANPELAAILAALTGLRTKLIGHIDKVNTCVDLATGPQTIADFNIWNEENTAAWEHPGYVDPLHDQEMNTLTDQNAAREADRLLAERHFCNLHARFVSEKRMTSIEDNNIYLEKWYEVCTSIIKSMNWDILNLSPEMDDTFLNVWRRAELILNEEEYNFSTWAIFERITGTKPNTSSLEGRAQFNTFTTTYNAFCVAENFPH